MEEPKMRIGINALYWRPNAMGGAQTYCTSLIQALLAVEKDNEYVVFMNAEAAAHFTIASPRLRIVISPVPGRFRPLRLIWENFFLTRLAERYGVQIVHSLGYLTPLRLRVASVVTVLDMIHYARPQAIARAKLLLWRRLFPGTIGRASHIVTISDSVRNEVIQWFPKSAGKITTVYLGVDRSLFKPLAIKKTNGARGGTSSQYVLAVASMLPHKNIDTLVRAFAKVKRDLPLLKLVLAGLATETSLELAALAERLAVRADVNLTGRVTDSELVELYQHAGVMVFPSLYEGFGLPPLEAMACGCPVIASNASAVPEIVGTAALQFDPLNPDELAALIQTVLTRDEARQELIDRGRRHALRFTWEETARQTLRVYQRCLQGDTARSSKPT